MALCLHMDRELLNAYSYPLFSLTAVLRVDAEGYAFNSGAISIANNARRVRKIMRLPSGRELAVTNLSKPQIRGASFVDRVERSNLDRSRPFS